MSSVWQSTRPRTVAVVFAIFGFVIAVVFLIAAYWGLSQKSPAESSWFDRWFFILVAIIVSFIELILVWSLFTRIRWNDEWIEAVTPAGRTKMRWDEIRDYTIKSFREMTLSGSRKMQISWDIAANSEVFEAALHAKLQPLRAEKARTAIERGSLALSKGKVVWRGGAIEQTKGFSSNRVNIDQLVLVRISEVKNNGFTQNVKHRLEESQGNSLEILESWPDSDVLLEILRKLAPKDTVWSASGAKLEPQQALFAVRKEMAVFHKSGKRAMMMLLAMFGFIIAMPVWYGIRNALERGGDWLSGVKDALIQSAPHLVQAFLGLAIAGGFWLSRYFRLREQLRKLETEQNATRE